MLSLMLSEIYVHSKLLVVLTVIEKKEKKRMVFIHVKSSFDYIITQHNSHPTLLPSHADSIHNKTSNKKFSCEACRHYSVFYNKNAVVVAAPVQELDHHQLQLQLLIWSQ